MIDAVIEYLCGFIIIMAAAIFYVLWDNSVKKFDEYEKYNFKCKQAQEAWMTEVENILLKCSNTNLYYLKEKHDIYSKYKRDLENCNKKH
jgi:hypothetical protein